MEKWPPLKVSEYELCAQFMREYGTLKMMNQFKSNPFVFHVANERHCSIQQHIRLRKIGLVPGVADYIVLLSDGRVATIEFKRDTATIKKLSTNQSNFRDMCKERDIPYLLTCSVEEAIEFLKSL